MWNLIPGNKAIGLRAVNLLPETKFHIQKYDGFENRSIEKPSLGSSTDTNLGHQMTMKFKKNTCFEIYVFLNWISL